MSDETIRQDPIPQEGPAGQEGRSAPAARGGGFRIDPQYLGRLTLTLLGICLVVSVLLGAVNALTVDRIAAAKAEKTRIAMQAVLPADSYELVEDAVWPDTVTAVYTAVSGGETVGWAVEVAPNGFKGAISMVVGVDYSQWAVTGVSVVSHTETSNVGTKVVGDQAVLDRLIGLTYPVTLNGDENGFDAVSGATVSSRAVVAGVNAALEAARLAVPLA